MDPKNFGQADTRLGTRDSRKIANNTYLQRRDADTIAVMLHSTDVVTFHRDGTMTLDSGGWHTVTTKDRMNRYTPAGVRVYSVKGEWTVNGHVYYDGIRIADDGSILTDADKVSDQERRLAENRENKKKISKFLALVRKEWKKGIPVPSGGDCWICLGIFRDGDTDHLFEHMDEGYVVPQLIVNAVKEYNPYFVGLMSRDGETMGGSGDLIGTDMISRSLRKYLESRILT